MNFPALWAEATPFAEYLRPTMKHYSLWHGIASRARPPEWARQEALTLGPLHLLVIAEDWCGDAANTVPVLAAWADAAPNLDLRVLPRNQYPAVMDAYLTNGTRSIPIVIALDEAFRELGHWGPRPAELQAWVLANRSSMPKDRRYAETRRWYARDRGETTLRELLAAIKGKAA